MQCKNTATKITIKPFQVMLNPYSVTNLNSCTKEEKTPFCEKILLGWLKEILMDLVWLKIQEENSA